MQIKNLKYYGKLLALALTTSVTLCGCGNEYQEVNTSIETEIEKDETFQEKLNGNYEKLTSIGIYYYESNSIYNVTGKVLTSGKTEYITGRENSLGVIYKAIKNAPNLEEITVCSEQLEDIELLTKIEDKEKIKTINVYSNYPFEDLTFLNDYSNIEELTISINTPDFSALNNLTTLTSLTITPFIKTKLPALELPNLKYLKVYNPQEFYMSKYSNKGFIDSITNLTELETLFIHNMDLSSVDFSKLENLQILNLKNAQISDISALENLKSLTCVQLEDNKISDITALYSLPKLKIVDLDENSISKSMFDGLVEKHILTEEQANASYETQTNAKILQKK